MTSHLDSGPSDAGHPDTEPALPARPGRESNWLLQQVDDRATAHRLTRRLTGHGLPEVELRTLHAALVPLRSHVGGWVAVEFFPGEGPRAALGENEQTVLMRAHAEGFRELAAVNTRTLSVISDPPTAIDLTGAFIDPRGLALCDPELLIAQALGLPSVQAGEVTRYRRLTLLARDSRIEKVIFPPEENADRHFQRVATWIQAARR